MASIAAVPSTAAVPPIPAIPGIAPQHDRLADGPYQVGEVDGPPATAAAEYQDDAGVDAYSTLSAEACPFDAHSLQELAVRRRIAQRVDELDLPAVFCGTRFETLAPDIDPEAFTLCEQYAEARRIGARTGLLLVGPTGCGKTTLAVAVLRRVIERTAGASSAAFWSVPRRLAEVTPDVEPGAAAAASFAGLRHRSPVVLDDLASNWVQGWFADALYVYLDQCWSGQRQLVVTTNESPAALRSRLAPGLVSRLLGTCYTVTFEPQDLRLRYLW